MCEACKNKPESHCVYEPLNMGEKRLQFITLRNCLMLLPWVLVIAALWYARSVEAPNTVKIFAPGTIHYLEFRQFLKNAGVSLEEQDVLGLEILPGS